MNLARAFHRRRHGTGYSNNAVTFTGVSGAPDPGSSPQQYLSFFQTVDNVDDFAAGVDRWGADVVGGHFDAGVQTAAEAALARLRAQSGTDAYAKLMLDQAAQTLSSSRQSAAKQVSNNMPAVIGSGGTSIAILVAVGVGLLVLMK